MQLEATGKSVEIAIQNGLLECGLKREDVEIKVLDEGGLFKKAKVLLTWGEKKEEIVEEIVEETTEEVVEENPIEAVEPTEEAEPIKKKRIVDTTRVEERGKEFLLGLARLLDENATVDSVAGENEVTFSVKGENSEVAMARQKAISAKLMETMGL